VHRPAQLCRHGDGLGWGGAKLTAGKIDTSRSVKLRECSVSIAQPFARRWLERRRRCPSPRKRTALFADKVPPCCSVSSGGSNPCRTAIMVMTSCIRLSSSVVRSEGSKAGFRLAASSLCWPIARCCATVGLIDGNPLTAPATRETPPGVTRNSGSPHPVMDELRPSRRPPPTARRSPTPISTKHRGRGGPGSNKERR